MSRLMRLSLFAVQVIALMASSSSLASILSLSVPSEVLQKSKSTTVALQMEEPGAGESLCYDNIQLKQYTQVRVSGR